MDWASLAGQITGLGAPILGSILGGAIAGPAGAALGSQAGKILASALGVEATPEAVQTAIQSNPNEAAAKIQAAESAHKDDLAALQAELADIQSARATMTALASSGSRIAWGPSVISTIVVVGNILIGLAAMFHPVGADPGVVLFLLGGWNTAFASVISFWMGSSSGSQKKDAQIGQFLNTAAAPVGRAVERAVTAKS